MPGIKPERQTFSGKVMRDAGLVLAGAGLTVGVGLGLVSVAKDMGLAMSCGDIATCGHGRETGSQAELSIAASALGTFAVGGAIVFASGNIDRRRVMHHEIASFHKEVESIDLRIDEWRNGGNQPPANGGDDSAN